MFAARYFAARYFPPRYFPEHGNTTPTFGIYFAPVYFASNYFAPRYFPGIQHSTPSAVVGGIVKRKKRYEVEVNGQKFVALSVPALEALVLAWRRAHPANDPAPPKPEPKPIPKPPTASQPVARPVKSSGPERREIRGTTPPIAVRGDVHGQLIAAQASLALQHAQREQEEALRQAIAEAMAQAQAEEEDDIEAIMAILRVAA